MPTALSVSILKTISYFDIFDYPLTREEIYHFLWEGDPSLKYEDFVFAFDQLLKFEFSKKLSAQGGYYFFSARKGLIEKRERKILYTEEKIKIAGRGISKLRYIPFIRAVFVCNQLPVGVKEESDIDLFIVIKPGRMWFTRALITALLSFFLLRRTNRSIADMLCLSFYVTEDNLDLSSICINTPDVYQAYWIEQLIPLYDPMNFLSKIQAKNAWVQEYIPSCYVKTDLLSRWKVEDTRFTRSIKKFLEWVFGGLVGFIFEKQIRFLQLQKMKFHERVSRPTTNKNVVISDTMLKFHENDRKEYFKHEWEKRWKEKIAL